MYQHATALGGGFTVCNLSVLWPGFSGLGGHLVVQGRGPVFRGQKWTTFCDAKREHPLWVLAVSVGNIGPLLELLFGSPKMPVFRTATAALFGCRWLSIGDHHIPPSALFGVHARTSSSPTASSDVTMPVDEQLPGHCKDPTTRRSPPSSPAAVRREGRAATAAKSISHAGDQICMDRGAGCTPCITVVVLTPRCPMGPCLGTAYHTCYHHHPN